MKIKTKIRLGFGFLFLIVLGFGAISLYYMNLISANARVILKDNYKSLGYVREMRKIQEDQPLSWSKEARTHFEKQLGLERQNITETGEIQALEQLQEGFRQLGLQNSSRAVRQQALRTIQVQLRAIETLNMRAIVRKNDQAQRSVERAASCLILAASGCFILLFSFSINFPGFVANPLREFSAAIKAVGVRNYKQRLEFKGNDEFSGLAEEFNAMVAQLHRWENSNLAKLQSEKLRIEAIIGQMKDAIIGLNEKQEILFLNQVAANLLDLEEKKLLGTNALELSARNELFRRIMETRNPDDQLKIFTGGKTAFFRLERMEITVPAWPDKSSTAWTETKKDAGEVYILKNITQYKELDEAKTNFMATISHELKTPISSIKMSLMLLNDARTGEMNPEHKELTAHIEEDCNRLLKITSELLDLARAETGNLRLNFATTDPCDLARYAIDALRSQLEQRTLSIALHCPADLPALHIDREKTGWVLVNFLSNAMRYSPEGSRIDFRLQQRGEEVEFSVQDYGTGIEEQYQERLFDRYFQVPSDARNQSGTGLGLAISKDFIEAQGGTIGMESALGEGSRFYFLLPAAATGQEAG